MLKLNPLPDIIPLIKSSTPEGIEMFRAFFTISREIENLVARAPRRATIGIRDKTKKKARFPGKILISGFLIKLITFLKKPFARSILINLLF